MGLALKRLRICYSSKRRNKINNERIDQLWAQALDAAVPETYTRLSHSQVLKIKQVFAKLIVEECVAQCWTVSAIEHKGTVISECSKRMRKHFGVEE